MIAYLKKEDVAKENEIGKLKEMVREIKTEASKEKEQLEETYSHQIAQLEASLSEKDEEVCNEWYEVEIPPSLESRLG